MKYSFMLAKLASLMNFTGVIADGTVAAGKKWCHSYCISWRVSGDNHKFEEEGEEPKEKITLTSNNNKKV